MGYICTILGLLLLLLVVGFAVTAALLRRIGGFWHAGPPGRGDQRSPAVPDPYADAWPRGPDLREDAGGRRWGTYPDDRGDGRPWGSGPNLGG